VILKGMFSLEEMEADLEGAKTLRAEIEVEAKKIGETEKVTVFERNPEGVVAVKFKLPASAEECIGIMNDRFFGGRQITCDFWDGATNYVVKETAEKEEARLESFGNWLEVLVRIHFIIVMIRWTGLAPWRFEFPFPGSLTSTFL